MVSEIIKSRAKKTGQIDYFDAIKIAANAGFTYNDFKESYQPEEKPMISRQTFSKLKNGQLQRIHSTKGNRATPTPWINAIKQFWCHRDISKESPNKRLVTQRTNKKSPDRQSKSKAIRYRLYSIAESFRRFQDMYPGIKISRSTFFKYKPKFVKKPISRQDCCPICKESAKYKPVLEKMNNLSAEEVNALNAYKFHEHMKVTQNAHYKESIKNLKEKEAVMVMDFKANISLGKGPEEDSHVFFSAPQRSILGVVVYFRKGEETYKVIFTIISPVLMHDSKTVLEMLRDKVFPHPVFNHFGVEKISLWSDNAPNHFRTKEHMCTLYDLQQEFGRTISCNFFCQYHGKSECDRHFGLISRMYTEATTYSGCNDITTTEKFLSMYRESILCYGGQVIPTVGASYDELHPKSSKLLNVVPSEWIPDSVAEYIKEQDANRTTQDTTLPKMPMPYTQRKLKVSSTKGISFVLNNYYQFSFTTKVVGSKLTTVIRSQLHNSVHQRRIMDFPFTVKSNERPDYSVKLGVTTSVRPKFSDLDRITKCFRAYEATDPSDPDWG